MQNIYTRCILKNDSAGRWTEVQDTAVLLRGEMGIEFDAIPESVEDSIATARIKIGDGYHTWRQLNYYTDVDPAVVQATVQEAVDTYVSQITSDIDKTIDEIVTNLVDEGELLIKDNSVAEVRTYAELKAAVNNQKIKTIIFTDNIMQNDFVPAYSNLQAKWQLEGVNGDIELRTKNYIPIIYNDFVFTNHWGQSLEEYIEKAVNEDSTVLKYSRLNFTGYTGVTQEDLLANPSLLKSVQIPVADKLIPSLEINRSIKFITNQGVRAPILDIWLAEGALPEFTGDFYDIRIHGNGKVILANADIKGYLSRQNSNAYAASAAVDIFGGNVEIKIVGTVTCTGAMNGDAIRPRGNFDLRDIDVLKAEAETEEAKAKITHFMLNKSTNTVTLTGDSIVAIGNAGLNSVGDPAHEGCGIGYLAQQGLGRVEPSFNTRLTGFGCGTLILKDLSKVIARGGNTTDNSARACGIGGRLGSDIIIDNVHIFEARGGGMGALDKKEGNYGIGLTKANSTDGGIITIKNSYIKDVIAGDSKASAIGGDQTCTPKIYIENTTIDRVIGGASAAGIGGGFNRDPHYPIEITIIDSDISTWSSSITSESKGGTGIGSGYDRVNHSGFENPSKGNFGNVDYSSYEGFETGEIFTKTMKLQILGKSKIFTRGADFAASIGFGYQFGGVFKNSVIEPSVMLFTYPALLPKDITLDGPEAHYTKTKNIGHGAIRVIERNTLTAVDDEGNLHDYGDGFSVAPYIFPRRLFTSTEFADSVDKSLTESSIVDFLVYGDNDFNIQGYRYKSPMLDMPFIVDYSKAVSQENPDITDSNAYIGLNTKINTKNDDFVDIQASFSELFTEASKDISNILKATLKNISGSSAQYFSIKDLMRELRKQEISSYPVGELVIQLVDKNGILTEANGVVQTAVYNIRLNQSDL